MVCLDYPTAEKPPPDEPEEEPPLEKAIVPVVSVGGADATVPVVSVGVAAGAATGFCTNMFIVNSLYKSYLLFISYISIKTFFKT